MAYIAKADGTREPIKTPISLKQAQKAVGGYVQRFFATNGRVVLCDEEGLLKQKPLNEHGTALIGHMQPIVGDIIVFESSKEERKWK